MAQLDESKVKIVLDVDMSAIHEARTKVRRLVKDINELNRTLARLEADALGLQGRLLEEYGINLEVSDV